MKKLLIAAMIFTSLTSLAQSGVQWLTFEGKEGPGKGKHIVLISGDEEYRSEEALPMMAKILSKSHGFKCTVLFALDPTTGIIDPKNQTNIPGLSQLGKADLVLMSLRFRELPDSQMKYFDAYLKSGKPIVALRTSTHAFKYAKESTSAYIKYSYDSKVPGWVGGFGKMILGETWVSHHGVHAREGTRALINGLMKDKPILRGVRDIWAPTDVYTVSGLSDYSEVLLFGQSTLGMNAQAPLSFEKSVMPVAWISHYHGEKGNTGKIFTTTMGAAVDLNSEDLRRLLINACYWALGLENQIPEKNNAELIGPYEPTMFGFDGFRKGIKPSDYGLK